jgi:hypothetical protein
MSSSVEKRLESNFVAWCKAQDVLAIKGPANMAKGIPDRIVIIPNFGGTLWVEFKGDDTYYSLTPMQVWWKKILQHSDPQRYFVIDTPERLEKLKKRILEFMQIGKALVEYEKNLLKNL